MAPRSKDAAPAPTITTHHSMAAGGQPSAAHESSETAGTTESEAVLTRPKKLVLQPMHPTVEPDERTDKTASEALVADTAEQPTDDEAPLVLETAAETEAASKLAAKLPEGKIELPLEEVALEEVADDELAGQPEPTQVPEDSTAEPDVTAEVAKPGEVIAEVNPNEMRTHKAEALVASGKYTVHIHESSRSRVGLIAAIIAGAVVILVAVYFAAAEGMLDVGIDLPKFW